MVLIGIDPYPHLSVQELLKLRRPEKVTRQSKAVTGTRSHATKDLRSSQLIFCVIWKAKVPWGSFPVFQAFRNRARHSWSDHELPTHRFIGTWRHWLRFSTLRPPLETCGTWPANERPQFGRVATAALHRLEHRHVDQPGGLAVVKPPLNWTRCIESQRIGDKYWSIIKFHKFLLIYRNRVPHSIDQWIIIFHGHKLP